MKVKIEKTDEKVILPEYKTKGSSGMDICAFIKKDIVLESLERKLIPTGIKIELPQNYEAQIRPRSGLSTKFGITLINCVGTIDEDYRGEICVGLINLSKEKYTIKNGDRIAQIVFSKVEKVELIEKKLNKTQRQEKGFGSTGF